MPAADWVYLNGHLIFENPDFLQYVAPFPPENLMMDTAATSSKSDFAQHGTHFYISLQNASPVPLDRYKSILDFGCGCARLGRMFKGHPGKVTGCDIDARHVEWINSNLTHMCAVKTEPNEVLPFEDGSFDAVISISVFSHITEASHRMYLAELARVTQPGAYLFLTTHGERAFTRVNEDEGMFRIISTNRDDLLPVAASMEAGRYTFIKQVAGHPTESDYDYGITFIPSSYIRAVWSEYFEIVDIVSGAIHDWQDIVVCRRR